jgi:hypothetical protein
MATISIFLIIQSVFYLQRKETRTDSCQFSHTANSFVESIWGEYPMEKLQLVEFLLVVVFQA